MMPFEDVTYSTQRADVSYYVGTLNLADTSEHVEGPYFTGNVAAVLVNLASSTPEAMMKLDFYADNACTVFMGGHQFELNTGGSIFAAFPALGAWCQWKTTPKTAPYSATARLSSSPYVGKPNNGPSKNLIIASAGNVGAGANIVQTAVVTAPGEAYWQAGFTANDAGAWEAKIEALNVLTGAVALIDYGHSRDGRINRKVYLPSRPLRMTLTNLDGAAAHPYNMSAAYSLTF